MATLYRKYRPQNFEEVVGQNHIKLTLEHEIESGKLAHAFLFCGPRAVGKTTIARVLSKAVNCLDRKEGKHDPCNICRSCTDITAGRSLDIIEIDAASHTGVDNVRDNIIAQARVSPVNSKFKVFIIDEVHMLSISSFNALLKVLEEPPVTVIFILCTTETHKVPMTIISRCQRFDFKRIGVNDIVKKLNYIIKAEGIKVDKGILESIARQSEGHMRDAESLLGQIVSISGKEITREEADLVIPRSDMGEVINLIDSLARKDASAALTLINKLVDQGVDLKTFTTDLIEVLRKMMFAKLSAQLIEQFGLDLGEAIEIKINEINKDLNINSLLIYIEQFLSARNNLKGSFITQMPLEISAIKICAGLASQTSVQAPLTPTAARPNNFGAAPANMNKAPQSAPVRFSQDSGGVGHGQIIDKWNEVLAKVGKYNHSLSFILRVCEPRGLNGNQLCLAFKYKFHKDRVNDPKIKEIIEKVLAEVYGASLTFETIIDEAMEVKGDAGNGNQGSSNNEVKKETENIAVEPNGNSNLIDNLLKTFGGKVVG